VERGASSPSPDSSVSFRMSSVVTLYEHHVQENEDTEDVIEDPEPEGQIQDYIVAHKSKRNIRKLTQFSDMVMAYALSVEVVKDSVPCSFKVEESSSEFELWRNDMVEEIESLYLNDT